MKRVRHRIRSLAAGLLAAGLVSCSLGGSPAVSRDTLAQQIATATAPVVLDVRSPSEYDAGHLPGAINIPFQSVRARHGELSIDADAPIVVYCAHGPRAAWAGRALRKAGYTHVLYLDGHMTGWKKAGLPTEATPAAVEEESP